jgi:hypothetical protein
MLKKKQIESFLKAANHNLVCKETGLSRPTVKALSNGGYDIARYATKVILSDFITSVRKGDF